MSLNRPCSVYLLKIIKFGILSAWVAIFYSLTIIKYKSLQPFLDLSLVKFALNFPTPQFILIFA